MELGNKTLVVIDLETSGLKPDRPEESIYSLGLVASKVENERYRIIAVRNWNVVPLRGCKPGEFWEGHPVAYELSTREPRIEPRTMMRRLARTLAVLRKGNEEGILVAAQPARFEEAWLKKYQSLTGVRIAELEEIFCISTFAAEHAPSLSFVEIEHPHVGVVDAFGESMMTLALFSMLEKKRPPRIGDCYYDKVRDRVLMEELLGSQGGLH